MTVNHGMTLEVAYACDKAADIKRTLEAFNLDWSVPPEYDFDSMLDMLDKINTRAVAIRRLAVAMQMRIARAKRMHEREMLRALRS